MESENINPWWSIWIHPRKTIRFLMDTRPRKTIIWLAILGGLVSSLAWLGYLWMRFPEKGGLHHAIFILSFFVTGAVVSLLHLYFGGWLYQLTGSWLGGKGNFTDLKCAVGWSYYPFIIANIFSILGLIVIPNPYLQGISGLLNLTAVIWAFVIFVNMVAEAHGFISAWKGVLTLIISWVLIFVGLMLISLLVPLLSPLFQ